MRGRYGAVLISYDRVAAQLLRAAADALDEVVIAADAPEHPAFRRYSALADDIRAFLGRPDLRILRRNHGSDCDCAACLPPGF